MAEQAFRKQGRGGNRIAIILLGTVGVFLVAGILFQIFRAKPGEAGSATQNSGRQNTQQSPQQGTIDAIVGNQQITSKDLAIECYNMYRKEVLEKMINRLIIQQACEKNGISVLKSEVEQEILSIAQKFKLDVPEWYKMLEAERGITASQYQKDVIWPMLALRKLAGVNATVTREEFQQAYERAYGPKVKARIIVLDTRKEADQIWNKLKQDPTQFEKLAQEHSIDPSTRPLGGVVPPIQKYSGNELLWQTAFKLKAGEISSVLVLFGDKFVILKSEGMTKPVTVSPQDVQDDLIAQIKEQKQQVAVAKIFEQIKNETRVVNKLEPAKSNLHPQQNKVQQVSGSFPPKNNSPVRTAEGVKPNNFAPPTRNSANSSFNPNSTIRR